MNRSASPCQRGAIGVTPLFGRGVARMRAAVAFVRRALGGALLAAAVPALLPLATTGCGTVPETGRRQFVALSADTERSLGEAAFEEMLSGAKVVTSGPEFARVQRVGQRIAEASVRRYPDACAEFAWQFALIDTPEVNAWMLPGGKSGVNTGLLTVATTDDELAVVMGHEAAHAIARHGAERISRGMAAQVVFGVAAASGEVDPALVEATAVAYGALGETAFSRGEEGEADHIGLLIAADAGYDPRAAVEFWRKMGALGGAKPPEFLSTHPSDETRATRLAQLMPQALEVHRRAKEAGR
jgi:predicted Zn-dependent protease